MNSSRSTDIELLSQFFDKIYVISLDVSSDRQKRIAGQLKGLNYSFFEGVDGSTLDLDFLEKAGLYSDDLTRSYWKKGMTRGQIGCAMAHRNIYKEIMDNDYENTLILEDDVSLCATISHIRQALSELPEDWDLLYLGYHNNFENSSKKKIKTIIDLTLCKLGLKRRASFKVKNRYAKNYSSCLKIAGDHDGTYAYAVSKAGAKKLLEEQKPLKRIADHLLADLSMLKKVNAYIVCPQVIEHNFHLESVVGSIK